MTSYTRRILIGAMLVMMATVFVGLSVTAENGWISGTVSDSYLYPYMGNPIAGATVSVVNGTQTATTNATGDYNITVPEGNYTVTISATGFISKTSSQIKVTANNTTSADFYLAKPTGNVSGTITDADDHTPIDLVALTPEGYIFGCLTGSDGKYLITGLPVGSINISAVSIDHGTFNFTVTILAGQTVTKDIQMKEPSPVIIKVVDSSENPIAGATVSLGSLSATTDSTGVVTFNGTPGTVTLTVKANDYVTYSKSATIDKGGDLFTVPLEKKSEAAAVAAFLGFALGICLAILIIVIVIVVVIIWLIIRWMRGKKAQAAQQPLPPPPPPLTPPQGPPFPPPYGQTPPPPPSPPQAPPQN